MTEIGEEDVATQHQSLRDAAIGYAARGWPVVRLYGLREEAGRLVCDCSQAAECKRPGKHPNVGNGWPDMEIATIEQVQQWWSECPNANIGIRTGREFGVVVDVDVARNGKDGIESLRLLEERFGSLPATLTARTGSGGLHFVYRVPKDLTLGNHLPPLFRGSPGIDFRGIGTGLVVVAPSRHVSGAYYEWLNVQSPVEIPDEFFVDSVTGEYRRHEFDAEFVASRSDCGSKTLSDCTGTVKSDAYLRQATLRLLRKGRAGGDQSEVVYSICVGAASVGYDPSVLFDELQDRSNKGGRGLWRRSKDYGSRVGESWFVTTWNNAQADLDANVQKIRTLRAEAEATPWWSDLTCLDRMSRKIVIKGSTLRTVLMAALDFAEDHRTTQPMLGKTEHLPDLTGLTSKTIRKALLGLEHLGWLWEARSKPRQASNYQFRLDPAARDRRWSTDTNDAMLRRHAPYHQALSD